MSEQAGEYYAERAEILEIGPVPALLSGEVSYFALDNVDPGQTVARALVDWFCRQTIETEPFVLAGVAVPMRDRERVTELPRNPNTYSARRFASAHIEPYEAMVRRGGTLCLEAVTRNEVPPTVLDRATRGAHAARSAQHEDGQAYFLARTQGVTVRVPPPCAIVLWAEHQRLGRNTKFKECLTPRYLTTRVVGKELGLLPPLPQQEDT